MKLHIETGFFAFLSCLGFGQGIGFAATRDLVSFLKHAAADDAGTTSTFVPFAETEAERLASGDPRLSLEERYGDHAGYVAAVAKAAGDLVAQRFLSQEDAQRAIAAAEASEVLK